MPSPDKNKNREYARRYREKHREEARAYGLAYRKKYPERVRAKNKLWQETRGPIVEEERRVREHAETVECMICHRQFLFLGRHLKKHGLNSSEYKEQFPGARMLVGALARRRGVSGSARALRNTYDGREPDATLFSFLLGTMLGDGSLENKKRNARYADASSNESYATWKYDLLKTYFPTTITRRVSRPHKKTGRQYIAWFVRTASHPILTEWHKAWYPDHKRVCRDLVLQHLDAFALAVWFFDDGCHNKDGIYLYPLGFEVQDVEWLAGLLLSRFGLAAHVGMNRRGQALIRIPNGSRARFLALVQPHVAPGMNYKITGRREVTLHGAD